MIQVKIIGDSIMEQSGYLRTRDRGATAEELELLRKASADDLERLQWVKWPDGWVSPDGMARIVLF